jgi:hypothetical protein
MSAGAWMMVLVFVLTFGCLGFLLYSMVHSIGEERDRRRSIWKEYGLSLFLMLLFFSTWIGHGISQWQRFTDEQQEHQQEASIGDFLSDFGASTLENWQSEFLQLFSFVTLAALFIHKGSAESKDGEDKMEASLRRIEEKLGTLPDNAPKAKSESWKLPDSPDLSS